MFSISAAIMMKLSQFFRMRVMLTEKFCMHGYHTYFLGCAFHFMQVQVEALGCAFHFMQVTS